MRALISVSDKTGVLEFARELEGLGFEILSTGGTLKVLKDGGVNVRSVSDFTGFAECLDGRVKTLHPKVHGGILSIRDNEEHKAQLEELGIENIDLVAVNLYPFRETISKEDVSLEEAIENIDIGGPTMLRSSAKNHKFVISVCDYEDYPKIIESLKKDGDLSYRERYALALKVYQHTALYDSTISKYLQDRLLAELESEENKEEIENIMYPKELTLGFEKIKDLRYGENPHQSSGYYRESIVDAKALVNARQIHGKELSFNNINDTQGALACLLEFDETAVVAVKHANPCGVAIGDSLVEAYKKAHDCDPISIFGGIVACNREVDKETALEMNKIFLEIIIAPSFSQEALDILKEKKNLRLLEHKAILEKVDNKSKNFDLKKVSGGVLVQSEDDNTFNELKTVTEKEPSERELQDLQIALKVVKHTRSNGIVLVKDKMTIGIGPGQTNRIWALENAIAQSNYDTKGAVMASDAFFPFNDCVSVSGEAGISAILQPGGSMRDQESIDKANELGISMVFSGYRHFKH